MTMTLDNDIHKALPRGRWCLRVELVAFVYLDKAQFYFVISHFIRVELKGTL